MSWDGAAGSPRMYQFRNLHRRKASPLVRGSPWNQWWQDDARVFFRVVLGFLDGGGDLIFEIHIDAAFFLLRDVCELAIWGAGAGVDSCDVVFDLFVADIFPGGSFAGFGFAAAGFGGFAENAGDFIHRHAAGDLAGGDEFLDLDLALVELFEFGGELRIFWGKSPWRDPTRDPVSASVHAADAVHFVGDGFDARDLVGGEGAELVFAFLVGKDRCFADDLEFERL